MLKTKSFIIFGICLLAPQFAMAQEAIEWRVIDRYRLFEAKTQEIAIKPYNEISPSDKFLEQLEVLSKNENNQGKIYQNVKEFLLKPIDNDFDGKTSQIFEETHWQATALNEDNKPKNTRYYSPQYLYPENYFISANLNSKYILKGDKCEWSLQDENALKNEFECIQKVILPIKSNNYDGSDPVILKLKQLRNQKIIEEFETRIEIKDKLIIALGDSYSSGEGNPDSPQKFGNNDYETADFNKAVQDYFETGIDPYERWWAKSKITSKITPAKWWDGMCHRSLFSQHSIASIIYAAKNPHEATSFISFSCSGAETFGGILTSQNYPVGQLELGAPNLEKGEKFKLKPQLEAALMALCQNKLNPSQGTIEFSNFSTRFRNEQIIIDAIQSGISQNQTNCLENIKPRKVDTILLSVGGNDAGFVGAIINSLVPNTNTKTARDDLFEFIKETFNVKPSYLLERQVNFLLPSIYKVLEAQMKMGLAGTDTQIIQSQYPNSFLDETGANFCNGPNDNKLFSAFNSLYLDEKTKSTKRWRTEITQDEGRDIKENLFDPLNKILAKNTAYNWQIVSFGDKFERHGWCAGNEEEKINFSFPALDYNNQWFPFSPKDWDAYAPRTRLFRTMNDAALTQIGSNKGFPIIDKIFDQDRSVFATFGMFHPTAEAHTIMAIEVAKTIK